MHRDVEFSAEGVALRGWLYRPEGATGPVSTVVMAHGLSAVKELAGAGLAERGHASQHRDERPATGSSST